MNTSFVTLTPDQGHREHHGLLERSNSQRIKRRRSRLLNKSLSFAAALGLIKNMITEVKMSTIFCCAMTVSIMTLSITSLSIKGLFAKLSITTLVYGVPLCRVSL
jgi:hypothetical protein